MNKKILLSLIALSSQLIVSESNNHIDLSSFSQENRILITERQKQCDIYGKVIVRHRSESPNTRLSMWGVVAGVAMIAMAGENENIKNAGKILTSAGIAGAFLCGAAHDVSETRMVIAYEKALEELKQTVSQKTS
jgi:hypothetical protein